MKQMIGIMLAATFVAVAHAQMVSIIQTTDMRGNSEFSVMNREEHNALLKELAEEAKIYPAAALEAKKEWDEAMRELPPKERQVFQGNRIKPRTARKMGGDFSDREKAEKRKAQLEDRFAEKQAQALAKPGRKLSDAEVEKNIAREKAFENSFAAISKKMGDKLGRPVPAIGLFFQEPKQEEPKKEEPKKGAKAK